MDDPARASAPSDSPGPSPDAAQVNQRPSGPGEQAPETVPVDEAIRLASEEVRKAARLVLRSLRDETAVRLERLRKSPVVSRVDQVLDFVKKSPVQGALLALLVGFFLGRALRK
jgi:hypothetical protein